MARAPPCSVRRCHGMHMVGAHRRLTRTLTTLDSFARIPRSHSAPHRSPWWSENVGVPPLPPASYLRWTLGRVFTTNRRGSLWGTHWCHRRRWWSHRRWDMAGRSTASTFVSLTHRSYWLAGPICQSVCLFWFSYFSQIWMHVLKIHK